MAHESVISPEGVTVLPPLSPAVPKPSRVRGKLAQGLSIVDLDLDNEGNLTANETCGCLSSNVHGTLVLGGEGRAKNYFSMSPYCL